MPERDPDIPYWERKAAASQDNDDRLHLAQLYRERGQWEASCELCRAVIDADPEYAGDGGTGRNALFCWATGRAPSCGMTKPKCMARHSPLTWPFGARYVSMQWDM